MSSMELSARWRIDAVPPTGDFAGRTLAAEGLQQAIL
jgi:hypothetical protein